MPRYRAAWVLPIDRPPIPGGTVAVDHGLITSVEDRPGGRVEDLGSVAILPGLANAHTHLELSWMRGQVPPVGSMPAWAAALIQLRRKMPNEPREPIGHSIDEARASGTCLVGDVTNTLATYEPLAEREFSAAIFRELTGFNAAEPATLVSAAVQQIEARTPVASLRPSIVPHAPYSVSPALFEAIVRRAGDRPLSVHLGESDAEIEFLREGSGPWRTLLESIGAWNPSWTPPGCGPVDYMGRLGLLSDRLIAVHGVQFTDAELLRLAAAQATVVTCPRSNRWTGAGVPPIDRFYASGVRVAIGTDSLASVDDLNLFSEMAEVRRLAPSVPAPAILHSATQAGAEALGFGSELGTLTPGKRAQIIAVRMPAKLSNVEEYLLTGIHPRDVRWLDGEP
jgi:cytosine/adenosine deaminase-related metal-dependent hydrolase